MRYLLAAATVVAASAGSFADDKGTPITLAGMKSTTPAGWKDVTDSLTGNFRPTAQFQLPPADGDKEAAVLAIFKLTGSGTEDQNLERQRAKFLPAAGKSKLDEKKDKIKVGTIEATYQDISGILKKKPFPQSEKFTPVPGQRQLYVLFDSKDGDSYYVRLLGPEKTVQKHKKEFEEWLKNFK
ncbi:MAG TPA: hypothetical protein VGJ05_04915 [Fimbriiglobus sp.]|jgi:hypothetical protein